MRLTGMVKVRTVPMIVTAVAITLGATPPVAQHKGAQHQPCRCVPC